MVPKNGHGSSSGALSAAFSSGLLPALGSNVSFSSRNLVKKRYIISPYDPRYRFEFPDFPSHFLKSFEMLLRR